MKNFLFIIILFLGAAILFLYPANAQGLTGYVYEQNSGKKPVTGVMLKSFFANQTYTNDKGYYNLAFQEGQPGLPIVLNVAKNDWVITDGGLEINLPENPMAHPHNFIMCRKETWDKRNQEYNAVLEKKLRQRYEAQIANLKAKGTLQQQVLDSLQNLFAQQQKFVKQWAIDMSRTNLDDASAIDREADQLIKAGKIDEVRHLREQQNSIEKFRLATHQMHQSNNKKAAVRSTLEKATKEAAINKRNIRELANLAQLQFDFAKAETYLKNLADNDSTDFESLVHFAAFLQHQKLYDKAIAYYTKAALVAPTDFEKTKVLDQTGILYWEQNDFPNAEKLYKQGLELSRKLASASPTTYLPRVAKLLNSMAVMYGTKGNYAAAERALTEAISITRQYPFTDSLTQELTMAMMQSNVGRLNMELGKLQAAEKPMAEALLVYQKLYKTNADAYGPNLIAAQSNLAILYMKEHKPSLAEPLFLEILNMVNRLAEDNPDGYNLYKVITCLNLGELYVRKRESAVAKKYLNEVLAVGKQMAISYPTTYEPYLAEALNNLALACEIEKDFISAKRHFEEALVLYRRISALDAEAFTSAAADVQKSLDNLKAGKSNLED